MLYIYMFNRGVERPDHVLDIIYGRGRKGLPCIRLIHFTGGVTLHYVDNRRGREECIILQEGCFRLVYFKWRARRDDHALHLY